MNLADIRNAAFHQADWGPKQSPEAKERMNQFINRAYNLIALEAPFLFFEDILQFATEPDVIPDEADPTTPVNTITFAAEHPASGITTANSWVVDQDNAGAAGVINWPTDRSWDGRIIEIKDNNGDWHRNIIRTIYEQPIIPAVPAVASIQATATITVHEIQNPPHAHTAVGDKITLTVPGPIDLDMTSVALFPVSGQPAWRNTTNTAGTANAIAGPAAPNNTGYNDPNPVNIFIPFVTAVSVPPVVTLTAVPAGTLGNPFTLTFVPATGPSGGALIVTNFSGGVDAIPEIPAIPAHMVMSFLTPWDTTRFGPGPFQYRIYTEEYSLPDDVIQVNSTRLWKTNNTWPMEVISQYEAEQLNILNTHSHVAKGIPRTLFRRTHYQMPAPAVPPSVSVLSTLPDPESSFPAGVGWRGPEPAGTFEYKLTYCWGARDIWFRNPGPHQWGANAIDPVNTTGEDFRAINGNERWGQQRYREPRWESSSSPLSAQVNATNAGEHGALGFAVLLTLPNIEYIQGFYWNLVAKDTLPTTLIPPARDGIAFERAHAQKSGWFVRIYRRRVATNFTDYNLLGAAAGPEATIGVRSGAAAGDQILHKIEEDTSFYLLSEVHIDPLNQGFFIDDGQLLPDYNRRLRDTNGYMNIGLYPNPDKRYEVEVRCLRRPRPLTNDTDAPYIHAEACDILIDRTLQLLYETEGNRPMMKSAKERYERCLFTLTKRYGDLRPEAVAVRRRLVRARRGFGVRNPLRGSGGISLPFP